MKIKRLTEVVGATTTSSPRVKDAIALTFWMLAICFLTINANAEYGILHSRYQSGRTWGHAQIGPFQQGSSVRLTELKPTLLPLERVYNTRIRDNNGAFTVASQLRVSDHIEIEVHGKYHNINQNVLSDSPITLHAISDLGEVGFVNVNVLTDLERFRVKFLVQREAKTVNEAKRKAQSEILNIFGIEVESMPPSESLDIAGKTEADAILLALTIILQADHSAIELERLLETIGDDIRETGVLSNETIIKEIWDYAANANLQEISRNINRVYSSLNQDIVVSDFEKYIIGFLEKYSSAPIVRTLNAEVIDETSAILHASVNPKGAETTVVFEYHTRGGEKKSVFADEGLILGHSNFSVSAHITDLLQSTLYSYRVNAFNINDTVYGRHLSFATPSTNHNRFRIGYHVGITIMDYSLSTSSDYKQLGFEKVTTKPGMGFRVGISLNYALTQSLTLFSSPALSFYDLGIEFYPTAHSSFDILNKQTMDFAPIEFPLSLRYSFLKDSGKKPYLVAGIKYVYDLHSGKGKESGGMDFLVFATRRHNAQAELGVGLKKRLKHVNLSAGIQTVFGLNNMILPGEDLSWVGFDAENYYKAIDRLRIRGLVLSIVIE